MAIRIYDTVSGSTFTLPMLPESINFSAETTFFEYELLKTGRIKIPSGEELSQISFKGILPGEGKRLFPFVSNWRTPKSIQELWSVWRNQGRKLRITIDGTPINHGVYLESYEVEYSGGQGDYAYSITFVIAKVVEIKLEPKPDDGNPPGNGKKRYVKVTAKTSVRKNPKTTAKVLFTAKKGEKYEYANKKSGNWYRILDKEGAKCWINTRHSTLTDDDGDKSPDNGKGRTYTVKRGDTLWEIAQKFYGKGSAYTKIKKANGLTSNTIHTGQKLKIP